MSRLCAANTPRAMDAYARNAKRRTCMSRRRIMKARSEKNETSRALVPGGALNSAENRAKFGPMWRILGSVSVMGLCLGVSACGSDDGGDGGLDSKGGSKATGGSAGTVVIPMGGSSGAVGQGGGGNSGPWVL